MSRAHGRPLKIFKVFLYIFNYYFKKFSGTGKNYAQRGYSLYRGTHFKDNKGFEANWMQCGAF